MTLRSQGDLSGTVARSARTGKVERRTPRCPIRQRGTEQISEGYGATVSGPGNSRCVLLAGSSGTGEGAICRVGYSAMAAAWGHPAAAIDLDTIYQAVDPRGELAYSDSRNAMVLEQAAAWARSLVDHGWSTVIVTGNSIFDPYDTAPFVAALGDELAVHHVTLQVREEVVLARTAGQPDRDPVGLVADLRPESRLRHPGTVLLDSSDLDVPATLDALVRLVIDGAGLLNRT